MVWPRVAHDVAKPLAEQYAQQGLRADVRFRRLDARAPGREQTLERFLRYVRSQGVYVTVLLIPYPIEVYEAFATLPGRSVAEVETELLAMAHRIDATLIGSYDPRPRGIATYNFYDESHLRSEMLERLLMPPSSIVAR